MPDPTLGRFLRLLGHRRGLRVWSSSEGNPFLPLSKCLITYKSRWRGCRHPPAAAVIAMVMLMLVVMLMPMLMHHVSCIMYHVPCIMYHVSCIMYHVSCSMYHLS